MSVSRAADPYQNDPSAAASKFGAAAEDFVTVLLYRLSRSWPPQICDELPSQAKLHSDSLSFVERVER